MSSGSLAEVESLAIENCKTLSRKSGRGRLREVVVYERFQYKALTEDIFGVLGKVVACERWSHVEVRLNYNLKTLPATSPHR